MQTHGRFAVLSVQVRRRLGIPFEVAQIGLEHAPARWLHVGRIGMKQLGPNVSVLIIPELHLPGPVLVDLAEHFPDVVKAAKNPIPTPTPE